ncbi:MAG: sugar transferase, partial [Candidatus Omnitrophica bacterium]|nr:sugar transferase [Candidatus Omnitrophota bacterium]
MIKEKIDLFRKLFMALDILVVAISFFLAYMLRHNVHIFYNLDFFPGREVLGDLYPLSRYLNILPLVFLGWWGALNYFGLYRSFRRKKFFEIVWEIIRSTFFVMIVFAVAVFIFKLDFISRSFLFLSLFITSVLLIIERWIIVASLRFFRKRGYNYRNILLVGTGSRAERFIELVHKHSEWGLRIVGLIDVDEDRLGKIFCGEKVIGLLKDIPVILDENIIDEVIFIVPRKWLPIIEESLFTCEIRGVKTNVAADFFNMKIAHYISSDIGGIPLLGFKTTVGEEWQLLLKRLFDIIFSLIGLVITVPVFLILIVVIKWLSPGQAIFKQVRSGLNGRNFMMYKFRTMVDGADEKRHLLRSLNEMNGPVFKMHNDPRVTMFGRFLRRTSLDELPQLLNVIKGDMSIVGPRPPIPHEVEKYEVWQRRRLSMKPGLTCLWQANGRNNVDFDRWMTMDLEY